MMWKLKTSKRERKNLFKDVLVSVQKCTEAYVAFDSFVRRTIMNMNMIMNYELWIVKLYCTLT